MLTMNSLPQVYLVLTMHSREHVAQSFIHTYTVAKMGYGRLHGQVSEFFELFPSFLRVRTWAEFRRPKCPVT